jgi:hypothetical protein
VYEPGTPHDPDATIGWNSTRSVDAQATTANDDERDH